MQELLDSLKLKLLAKTLRTIDLLEINSPLLGEPYSKLLENGIFELRTRIFWGSDPVKRDIATLDLGGKKLEVHKNRKQCNLLAFKRRQ